VSLPYRESCPDVFCALECTAGYLQGDLMIFYAGAEEFAKLYMNFANENLFLSPLWI
jgi:hypothetical protein